MLELAKNLIKEKELLMDKVAQNVIDFKLEMIDTLEEETGVKFSVEEINEDNEPMLIFKAEVEQGYLYFIVDFEEYGLIDVEDQTEDQKYYDILWEIKEELGL